MGESGRWKGGSERGESRRGEVWECEGRRGKLWEGRKGVGDEREGVREEREMKGRE